MSTRTKRKADDEELVALPSDESDVSEEEYVTHNHLLQCAFWILLVA